MTKGRQKERCYECEACTRLFWRWTVHTIRRPRLCDTCSGLKSGVLQERPKVVDPDVAREWVYLGLTNALDLDPLDDDWYQEFEDWY